MSAPKSETAHPSPGFLVLETGELFRGRFWGGMEQAGGIAYVCHGLAHFPSGCSLGVDAGGNKEGD